MVVGRRVLLLGPVLVGVGSIGCHGPEGTALGRLGLGEGDKVLVRTEGRAPSARLVVAGEPPVTALLRTRELTLVTVEALGHDDEASALLVEVLDDRTELGTLSLGEPAGLRWRCSVLGDRTCAAEILAKPAGHEATPQDLRSHPLEHDLFPRDPMQVGADHSLEAQASTLCGPGTGSSHAWISLTSVDEDTAHLEGKLACRATTDDAVSDIALAGTYTVDLATGLVASSLSGTLSHEFVDEGARAKLTADVHEETTATPCDADCEAEARRTVARDPSPVAPAVAAAAAPSHASSRARQVEARRQRQRERAEQKETMRDLRHARVVIVPLALLAWWWWRRRA